jgi:hypothetical protein
MVVFYRRPPGDAMPLVVEPRLASWDVAGSPGQVRLADFLNHVDELAAPTFAATSDGQLAVEFVIGLPQDVSLTQGGRDLDNYLYPVAHRLGAKRLAAVFGRKTHDEPSLALARAEPASPPGPPLFEARISGSYASKQWKADLRGRLLEAKLAPITPGPVVMDIAVVTGPGRNWTNLWKPLVDSLGPLLGEDPVRPFHPYDDRITSLGFHHNVDPVLGHDVLIQAWWSGMPSA